MTRRERVIRAITFRGPDRAPIDHWVFPGAFFRHGQALVKIVERYPDDLKPEGIEPPEPASADAITEMVEWTDAWGTTWRRLRGYTSGEVKVPAIPTWDDWGAYQFPPLPGDEHFARFRQDADRLHPEWFVRGSGGGFFQHMQHLRGPANYFVDLAEDRREVHELADRMVEHNVASIRRYVEAGADCITFGDDWGAQDRLLVHPDMWRRFFKPRYQRMFDVAKDAGKLIWFHTDGWIYEIIDDLIEIGVDLLNPQHLCMGDERVAERCAGRVCIRTDIDRQHLIPRGSPDQIRSYVRTVLKLFGDRDGGIMLHGEIGPDVPLANIEALYAAFYDYGRYPFDWDA